MFPETGAKFASTAATAGHFGASICGWLGDGYLSCVYPESDGALFSIVKLDLCTRAVALMGDFLLWLSLIGVFANY